MREFDPAQAVNLERYRVRLERLARYQCGLSREDAEDAAQETLIRCRNVRFDGRDPYNFLARVLLNVVSDMLRKAGRRFKTVSLDAPLEIGVGAFVDAVGDRRDEERCEAQLMVDALSSALTERQRLALQAWCDTSSFVGVAEALDCSRQNAHVLMGNIFRKARASMEGV